MRRGVLLLGLCLGVSSSCKDDTPAADSAKTADTPKDEGKSDAETKPETESEAKPETKSATAGGSKKSGLSGLTSEIIDEARQGTNDPVLLLPSSTDFLISLEPGRLLSSPGLEALWKLAVSKSDDLRDGARVFSSCMGRLESLDRLVIGWNNYGKLAMVAEGKSMGTVLMWECFERKSSSWDLQITHNERGSGPQLLAHDSGDRGYFLDKDTVVFTSGEWDDELSARIYGKGTPGIQGRLAETAKRIDPEHAFWLVGLIDSDMRADIGSASLKNFNDVALSIELKRDDIGLRLSGDTGSMGEAIRTRDELEKEYDGFKAMLPMFGTPMSLTEKIEFERDGSEVHLNFDIREDELESMADTIKSKF